jgi:dTDP-4-amino-4,6-dideoxygalactose transaminase
MTAQGVYAVTAQFEKALCEYTGAPHCVVVDCCSHAIFLALKYEVQFSEDSFNYVKIPKRTFPSVPCEVRNAGLQILFGDEDFEGAYQLWPSKVWDAALRFTSGMYIKGTHMCVSFTGPRKRLKLIKGGAILTDDKRAYEWFKTARMSGRHEMPFMEDEIKEVGWNFYIDPEKSVRGLQLLREFYDEEGKPRDFPDVKLEYPDLSKMEAFR